MIFWHIIAIATVFMLGYFFGRWTIKDYYEHYKKNLDLNQ